VPWLSANLDFVTALVSGIVFTGLATVVEGRIPSS